jgi:hypothetical protein
MIYLISFLAGYDDICPPNWPFRWPRPPKGPWPFLIDILSGLGGIAGGELVHRLVASPVTDATTVLAVIAGAFVTGNAVRTLARNYTRVTVPEADLQAAAKLA